MRHSSSAWLLSVGAVLLLATVLASDPSFAQEEVAVAPPSVVVGPPAGARLSGERLESETERVASLVRCPVCQGLSVNDSPAPMAQNMKRQVGDLLAAGYTEQQILSYFERSYGEFVLLEPPLRGINWIVWLAPGFLLLVGIVVVALMFRRTGTNGNAKAGLPLENEEDATDPYLMEVRRLAYGEREKSGR